MSRLTDYLKAKRGKFIGLELIYNDLGVRDFLDRVESEGLSEVRKFTAEETKEMMEQEGTKVSALRWEGAKKVAINGDLSKVNLEDITSEQEEVEEEVEDELEEELEEKKEEVTIKKSKLGKKLERGEVDMSRREEIGKGLAEFLKKYE